MQSFQGVNGVSIKMINAHFCKKNTEFIYLESTTGKHARVIEYASGWQIHYLFNGQRKNGFESYQAVLDYLVKKGW